MTLDARKAHDGRIKHQANEVAIYLPEEPFCCVCLKLYKELKYSNKTDERPS